MKKLLIVVVVLILGVPAAMASVTDYFIELESPFVTYQAPRGSARITSASTYYMPRSRVALKTSRLLPSRGFDYQAWLVDRDTDTWMNAGKFKTTISGIGSLNFRINHYLDAYDELVVTKEPKDRDPSPSREVVLVGQLVLHYQATSAQQLEYRKIP